MDELFISTKIKSSVSVEPKDLNNNLNRKIISKFVMMLKENALKMVMLRKIVSS